jgi:hypothetical protein
MYHTYFTYPVISGLNLSLDVYMANTSYQLLLIPINPPYLTSSAMTYNTRDI